MLNGQNIFLRQVEDQDANLLLLWENNTENWRYSETEAPYSLFEIQEYIKSASQIRQNKQLRFIICLTENNEAIGTIDLFNIDFKNLRAGVGILIANHENREKGYGKEALQLLMEFSSKSIDLIQLYCDIQSNNKPSIKLFESEGFIKTGVKKSWFKYGDTLNDAYFYQKLI